MTVLVQESVDRRSARDECQPVSDAVEIVPAGTYNVDQWRAIKASLAPFGIDVGAVMVGEPFRPGEPWWLPDHSTGRRRPLEDALQELAWYFAVVSSGVASRLARAQRRHAAQQRKKLPKLKAALAILDDYGSAAAHIRAELAELIARLDELTTKSGGSNKNAGKVHTQFWIALTRLWWAITANARRRGHKHLLNFLFACSSPLFPEATKDKALTAFIERNFPQTSR
jgi:hypothetical protein